MNILSVLLDSSDTAGKVIGGIILGVIFAIIQGISSFRDSKKDKKTNFIDISKEEQDKTTKKEE